MKTNDVKKGMRVRLTEGQEYEVADNRRGNWRSVVEGGRTLAFQWTHALVNGRWEPIELTPAQIDLRDADPLDDRDEPTLDR